MTPDAQSSARQAALLLHAMGDADRRWVLQALPQDQRTALQGMLAELRALGIAPEHARLEPAGVPRPRAAALERAEPAPLPLADRMRELSPAQMDELAAMLTGEPPSLAAHLLTMEDWPWRADVFGRLGSAHQRAVQDAQRQPASGQGPMAHGALREAILAEVRGRLPRHAPAAEPGQAVVKHGPWQWVTRLKAKARARLARPGSAS